ncbi:MAG: hypothetical protein JNM70_02590 [Anaerolineae bacterium]|nr:hypothetical protein [Anaerolineae bacterium]
MNLSQPRWKVNILFVALGTALVIVLTRLSSVVAPQNWYFTFGALLYEVPEPTSWQAVVIKFGIPVVVGLILGFVETENPSITAASAGFLGAFILTWPALTSWELYAPAPLLDRRGAFYLVYLFYFTAFAYLEMVGARLTLVYLQATGAGKAKKSRQKIVADLLDWKETVRPIVVGVITGVLSVVASKVFAE